MQALVPIRRRSCFRLVSLQPLLWTKFSVVRSTRVVAVVNMENDTAASGGMNLRLLINQKSGKILFAEAGKDFVDLLFTFLTLPTGSVMKLLSPPNFAKRVGCLTNVYNSVNKLHSMFMNADKSRLLEPNVMSGESNEFLKVQSSPTNYYVCGSQAYYGGTTHYMSTQSGGSCACGRPMQYAVQLQNPCNAVNSNGGGSSGGGYVKETVTFIITDELEISPASTITSINLLNKLKVQNLSDLVERNANVGPDEALRLLWACLASTTPLDDVFGSTVCTST